MKSSTKSLYRHTSQQVFKSNGKNEAQKRLAVKNYILQSRMLQKRFIETLQHPPCSCHIILETSLFCSLKGYVAYAQKFTDQIERRLLKGETIAAEEKVYSIFEEHTEWIQKGKTNKRVELGHLLLITTDQYQLIVDYKVMQGEKDASQVKGLKERIQKNYPNQKVMSHSFDKGFYSKENLELLNDDYTEQVIMPKKGKLNQEEKQREHAKAFIELRKDHSAVESNINMLEHHGLNRCVDKGMKGYKRNVGLSIMAYNLHLIGNEIIRRERQAEEKRRKARLRYSRSTQQAA
jgi:IS5 family transposase